MIYSRKWKLGEPFTILAKESLAGELCCPSLSLLPCGDLVITYADEGDFHYSRTRMLRSTDHGVTWTPDECPVPSVSCIVEIGEVVRAYDLYTFLVKDSSPTQYVFQYSDSLDGGKSFGPKRFSYYEHDGEHVGTIGSLNQIHSLGDNLEYWENVLTAAGWEKDEWGNVESGAHGPAPRTHLQLPDGSLLNILYSYCDRQTVGKPYRYDLMAASSTDGGVHWQYVSQLNPPQSEAGEGYAEGSAVMLDNGDVYVAMRHGGGGWPIMQTISKDCGRSWQELRRIDDKVRGVWPKIVRLSDGALAMCHGRPGMYLMFSPEGNADDWDVDNRLDIWDGELLTLKTNAKPVTSRVDVRDYMSCIAVPKEQLTWARQELLSGYFCSWENITFVEVSPGRILLVYDIQNHIEHPGAQPKKTIRGVWIEKPG